MKAFLREHLDDICLAMGAGVIVYATWLLNLVAALYVVGVILIAIGVMAGIGRGRRG